MQEATSRHTAMAARKASRALAPVAPTTIAGMVAIAPLGATAATDCARTGSRFNRCRSRPDTGERAGTPGRVLDATSPPPPHRATPARAHRVKDAMVARG